MKTPFFAGVGVGPGDPGLITLKARDRLQTADLIAWPAPEHGDSLALKIAAPHIPDGREHYAIRIPIQNNTNWPQQPEYDKAAKDLRAAWKTGKNIVVLCEGDPFFYGSFMYIYERLSPHISVEVIPGISSLTASAAACAMPLAAHNDSLIILPATLPEADLTRRLKDADAAVILKTGRRLETVRRALDAAGLLNGAQVAIHATMTDEHTMPLSEATVLPYFATIIARRVRPVSGQISDDLQDPIL